MRVDIDNALDNITSVTDSLQSYVEELVEQLSLARRVAKSNIEKQQQINNSHYDKKAKVPQFQVGQHIYLTVESIPVGVSRKLYPRYNGPFYIVYKDPNHSYILKSCKTNKLLKFPVHANRLKLFKNSRDFRNNNPSLFEETATDHLRT